MLLILEIAWRHVSTRIRQTLVAILGVSIGVAFTIMITGILQGRQIDFVRALVDSMPHVMLKDERQSAKGLPAEQAYVAAQPSNRATAGKDIGIKNPQDVMASLGSWLPGVIAPSVRTTVMVHSVQDRVPVTLTGIDPRREIGVSKLASHMRTGEITDLYKGSNSLLIGEGLAKRIGAKVGTTISLSTGEGLQIQATVVGLFRSGIREVDEKQVYSLVRTAQIILGKPGIINEMRIHLRDSSTADEIAKQVESQTGYRAISWQEANSDVLSTLRVGDIIMYIITAAMLLASTFGIYSIVSTITHEKRNDIAIMKSFGMKEGMLMTIFIIESAIIGAVGILAGFGLGQLLCMGVSQITYSNPFVGTVQKVPIFYTFRDLAAIGFVALAACATSAFFPARKASRVHPVDIIRGAT